MSKTGSQGAALKAAREWVAAALDGHGPMLALCGDQGSGKSHLLYSAALELAARRTDQRTPLPVTAPWYSLADELRYSDGKVETRARIYGAPILLIDEVRPTASTSFDDTELAKLACHAYDGRIALLITTNVYPLDKVMGPAAASRFRSVTVKGPDHRQRIDA